MRLSYYHKNLRLLIEAEPDDLVVLQAFAKRADEGLETVVVTLERHVDLEIEAAKAAARRLQSDMILSSVYTEGCSSYQLAMLGLALVTCCRDQILEQA